MPATLKEKREQLLAHAQQFVEEHQDENCLLSAEDQATVDAMLAAADTMRPGNGFTRQSELDKNPRHVAGTGRGVKLVDERGRIQRALGREDSFEQAIRENASYFGVRDEQFKCVEDGLTIGGFMRSLVTGPQTSAEFAALGDAPGTAGGYLVPEILSAQLIDLFRKRTVVLRAGAMTLPLASDRHSFARLTADATAAWRAEGVQIAESEPTFGKITFYPKSLAVNVRCSREVLEDSSLIDQAIERSLLESFPVEVDRVALLGAGALEPLGLRNEAGLNEITGIAALTDYSDFVDAWKLLLDDNVPDPTAAIISNRDWATLNKLEDTTGQPLMIPPAIADLPFLATSAIPTNLGGGANESIAFLGYFPDLILGMRSELRIEVLRERYAPEHQYAFIAHLRMDTGTFHSDSFCRMLGITP